MCERAYSDCIAANTSSSRAQDQCKTDIKDKCGRLDPAKVESSSPSEEPSSSSSSSGEPAATQAPAEDSSGTGSQNSNPSSSTSTGAAAPTNAAYIGNGVAVVAAGLFAALL